MATPGLGPAIRVRPTTVTGRPAVGVITRRRSPRCTLCRAAVVASTATSPGPAGARPAARAGECAEGYQLRASVGAPVVGPSGVLRASTTVALETVMSPWAAATPGTAAMVATVLSGRVGMVPTRA